MLRYKTAPHTLHIIRVDCCSNHKRRKRQTELKCHCANRNSKSSGLIAAVNQTKKISSFQVFLLFKGYFFSQFFDMFFPSSVSKLSFNEQLIAAAIKFRVVFDQIFAHSNVKLDSIVIVCSNRNSRSSGLIAAVNQTKKISSFQVFLLFKGYFFLQFFCHVFFPFLVFEFSLNKQLIAAAIKFRVVFDQIFAHSNVKLNSIIIV